MDRELFFVILYTVLGTLLLLFLVQLSCLPNRVTDELAVARIARSTDVQTTEVIILDQSNNELPFGNLLDVTYEIEIRGKKGSANCFSGWMYTSPMVCKLYWSSVPE